VIKDNYMPDAEPNTMKKIAVHKDWLLVASGLLWSGVGLLLMNLAGHWLGNMAAKRAIFSLSAGLFFGLLIMVFGFRRIVGKNIVRIDTYDGKVCLFAFQRWQSYLLILVMMSMGMFLRTSGLVGRPYLAALYLAIGMALFGCSFLYYHRFYVCRGNRKMKGKEHYENPASQ